MLANPNHADLVYPLSDPANPGAPLPKADRMAIAKALLANGVQVLRVPVDSGESTTRA
jgi:hypothetical protein